MSENQHWQQHIQALTQQESWEELDAFYENIIHQATDSSTKLYYIWERATLLCDHCNAFHQAIDLLFHLALDSGLVDTIVPRMEKIKRQAQVYYVREPIDFQDLLEHLIDIYQKLIQYFKHTSQVKVIQNAYQHTYDLIDSLGSYSVMSTPIPAIESSLTSPDPLLQAQNTTPTSHQVATEPSSHHLPLISEQADYAQASLEPFDTIKEDMQAKIQRNHAQQSIESIDGNHDVEAAITPTKFPTPNNQQDHPKPFLTQQDTTVGGQAPDEALLRELMSSDLQQNAMAFMVDLESLCTLRPLTFKEQKILAPRLWQAAKDKQQWRKWTQIYSKYFANNAANSDVAAQRTFTLAKVYETYLRENTTAVELYKEVLGYQPENKEAFDRLYVILSEQKRWQELTEIITRVTEHRDDKNELFDLYLMLGDLYRDHLHIHAKAVSAWFQALEIEPESRQIFVRLLEVYQQMEKWTASIKVLKKLVKLEKETEKKSYYTYTIALIYRDQLKDSYLAVRHFDEALDHNPHFLKAFQAIDDILTQSKDQARKDRYYRKMLIRAVHHEFDAAMIAELALQVGEINLHHLQEWEEAKRAYELVLNYRPSDVQAFQNLTKIYLHLNGVDDVLHYIFNWIRRHPTHIDAYQSLYRFTADHGRFDWAWCVASALQILQASDGESHSFVMEAQNRMSTRLQRTLNAAEWRMITWAKQDEKWSQVIALSESMTKEILAKKAKNYKIHLKKDRIETDPHHTFGRVIHYISTHLNLTIPSLWATSFDQGKLLDVIHLDSVGLLIDEYSLSKQPVESLVAYLTYGLYLAQSNFWLVASSQSELNVSQLQTLCTFHKQLKDMHENGGNKPSKDKISPWFSKQKNLSDVQKDHLIRIDYLPTDGAQSWIAGVEQTAYRLALLMSSRLNVVVELMKNQPSISGDSFETRLYKLLLFAVSPAYVELRDSLQLSLNIDA